MRKLLIAAAPLALVAGPALAQPVGDTTGTVQIDGYVTPRCLFTSDDPQYIHLEELALSGTGLTAGKLNTTKVDSGSATLVGWCNTTSADVTVEAFPLLNGTDVTGNSSFDNRVDYRATVTAGAAVAFDDTTDEGAGDPDDLGGLYSGNFLVDLSNSSSPNGGIMVAGDYNGYVEVTLTPNFVTDN